MYCNYEMGAISYTDDWLMDFAEVFIKKKSRQKSKRVKQAIFKSLSLILTNACLMIT